MPNSVTIARAMSVARCRSFCAPVEISPSAISSAVRPASSTASWLCRSAASSGSGPRAAAASCSPARRSPAARSRSCAPDRGRAAASRRSRAPTRGRRRSPARGRSSRASSRGRRSSRSIASSKSRISTCGLFFRAASSAASLTRFARSAPAKPAVRAATTFRSTSGAVFTALRVDAEDLLAPAHVRLVHQHLAVEAARPQQRRVEHLGAVGRAHDDDALARVEPVHLGQQLVQRLLALLVAADRALHPHLAQRVELVDEDDAGRLRLGLLEQVAHARRARRRRTSRRTPSRSG